MKIFKEYTDEQLIEMLAEGEYEAFTEIYNRHAERLFQFAWNILKDKEECRDAVQEIFVWLWEKRADLVINDLKSYLLAAVKYKLIRSIKRSKRLDEILNKQNTPSVTTIENTVELEELKKIIRHFTEGLPKRSRQVFELSREEHLSNKEIAAQMNIKEKTVENHMTIVLNKLRHTLNNMSFWSVFF